MTRPIYLKLLEMNFLEVGQTQVTEEFIKSKGYICRSNDVRQIVKQLDPDSVKLRKRRRLHRRRYVADGPNFVWHLDGHDKLKPFGFSIHGCIDRFSRCLIWLEVASSNKKPELIAKFYLDAVKSLEGIPLQIKADNDTEHSLIEPMHLHLSALNGNLEMNHFSIITSPQNERIESYLSILQRDRLGWWRWFFQDLVDLELLNTVTLLYWTVFITALWVSSEMS